VAPYRDAGEPLTALEAKNANDTTSRRWYLGVRARLLLAFFGISAFAVLAAVAGIYAFRQVGDRLELIDARVPQVVSSMEISRAADRLIASAPAVLAATTAKERDEISNRMQPEVERLTNGLIDIERSGVASEAAITIQLLVASLRSNLEQLENLVTLRLKIRERLAGLVQAAFQANQEAQRLFAPWLQVMEMQINRALDEASKQNVDPSAQAGRDLAASIMLDRSAHRLRCAASLPRSINWFRPPPQARSGGLPWPNSSCAGAWMISMPRPAISIPSYAPFSSIFCDAFAR
jgi:hypothetical protein